MKMTAKQSFHTSQTKTVHEGAEFEVSDALGGDLERLGYATKTGDSEPAAKAEAPLANKMEPVAETKARKRKVQDGEE